MPWGWVDNPCDDKEMLRKEINLYNAIEDRIVEKMAGYAEMFGHDIERVMETGVNRYGEKTCFARKAGWPSSFKMPAISCWVRFSRFMLSSADGR